MTFNDNNIIGYGSQSATCGFDITRIFSGMTDFINTPISYVDDEGEFQSIDIAFCTREQLTTIYSEYVERKKQEIEIDEDEEPIDYSGFLYNYSVFIDEEIFEGHGEQRVEQITHESIVPASKITTTKFLIKIDLKQYGFLPTDFNDDISSLNPRFTTVSYGGQTYPTSARIIGKDNEGNYIFSCLVDITLEAQRINLSLSMLIEYSFVEGVGGAKDNCDFMISEKLYNKDPIEVPVFEYCFQIDDSKDILIGSNILDNRQNDLCYFYQYAIAPKNTINDNNFENLSYGRIDYNGSEFQPNQVAKMVVNDNKLEIELYGQEFIDPSDLPSHRYFAITDIKDLLRNDEDLVITRVKPILDKNGIPSYERDLMLVVRNTENAEYETNDKMLLTINHYKLS